MPAGLNVGRVAPGLLVAASSCVKTLYPASMLDAISLGRAESSTSRAFSGLSADCGADITDVGDAMRDVNAFSGDEAACSDVSRSWSESEEGSVITLVTARGSG